MWKPEEFRFPQEIGRDNGAKHQCDTTNIHHIVTDEFTNEFRCLDMDFCFSSPLVESNKIYDIHSMIC
jgi:hypothetical protein